MMPAGGIGKSFRDVQAICLEPGDVILWFDELRVIHEVALDGPLSHFQVRFLNPPQDPLSPVATQWIQNPEYEFWMLVPE